MLTDAAAECNPKIFLIKKVDNATYIVGVFAKQQKVFVSQCSHQAQAPTKF